MRTYQDRIPTLWRSLDVARSRNGILPELRWPSWCLLPVAATLPTVHNVFFDDALRRLGEDPEGTARLIVEASQDDESCSSQARVFGWVAQQVANDMADPEKCGNTMAQLAGLYNWRAGQGVYVFDPDLVEALSRTRTDDRIPSKTLMRLPEYAPYLLLQTKSGASIGVLVWLDFDLGQRVAKLLISIDQLTGEPGQLPLTLYLDERTITESGQHMFDHIEAELRDRGRDGDVPTADERTRSFAELSMQLRMVLPFVLYLCSDEPDLVHGSGDETKTPEHARPTTTRHSGQRMFPPSKPSVWQVGWRFGRAVRNAAATDSAPSVDVATEENDAGDHTTDASDQRGSRVGDVAGRQRAHVRRAHWHLYWTGKGSRLDPARREPRVRWIPPTLVGAQSPDDLVAVVRRPESSVRHHAITPAKSA